MREKLIELCEDVIFSCRASLCDDCEHNGIDYPKCMGVHFADHLIANGVTVQQWIPVSERLPELIPCNAGTAYSEAVIVWTNGRKAMIAVWDGIDFLCAADYWEAWGENITHWMPLPEPPKEG